MDDDVLLHYSYECSTNESTAQEAYHFWIIYNLIALETDIWKFAYGAIDKTRCGYK